MASRLPPVALRARSALIPVLAAGLTLGLSLLAAGAAPAGAQTMQTAQAAQTVQTAQTAPDDDPPPDAPALVPNGNGCAGAVSRWQDFAGRESQGGHMDEAVYNQIQNEIDRASHLCEAGQDAQARRAVAESKRKHGY